MDALPPRRPPLRGRGSQDRPASRFEQIELELDPELEPVDPGTRYLRDQARSLLTTNDSPDIPFRTSANPYRGCLHACAYCYARPGHEYLGLSAGLDFETQIFVKENAPELLRRALERRSWTPQSIALSGVTDPYQPVERKLRLTRGCLEVLASFRNPVGLITKSALVARDIDVLSELTRHGCAQVTVSITTLDAELARRMEPHAAQPAARLGAVRKLARAGIPVGVNVAPVIPGLTDHEIPDIMRASADAGAGWANYLLLRLPHGVADLFAAWLQDHYPDRRSRVLSRIRDVRGGRLNDPHFGSRMRGSGPFAEQIRDVFRLAQRRSGLAERGPRLNCDAFRRPGGSQLALF
jgi:DNA repair photolyase